MNSGIWAFCCLCRSRQWRWPAIGRSRRSQLKCVCHCSIGSTHRRPVCCWDRCWGQCSWALVPEHSNHGPGSIAATGAAGRGGGDRGWRFCGAGLVLQIQQGPTLLVAFIALRWLAGLIGVGALGGNDVANAQNSQHAECHGHSLCRRHRRVYRRTDLATPIRPCKLSAMIDGLL